MFNKSSTLRSVWGILSENTIGVIPFNKNPLTENCVPTKLFEMMASLDQIVASDLAQIRYFVDDSVFGLNQVTTNP